VELWSHIIVCVQGTPTKEISKRREGEVWELQESGENAGKYILKACYKGSLLVNATLDTQVRLSAAAAAAVGVSSWEGGVGLDPNYSYALAEPSREC